MLRVNISINRCRRNCQVISISRVKTYTWNYRRGLPFQEYMVYEQCVYFIEIDEDIYI